MEFHTYRVHEDHRRSGKYDLIPNLPGDVNMTRHVPGVIPHEFHLHKEQTDYFAVVEGKALFRLVYEDGRPEEKFVVSAGDRKTLVIPPGVWHNYLALEPTTMVFYTSRKFDMNDEFRKPCGPEGWSV